MKMLTESSCSHWLSIYAEKRRKKLFLNGFWSFAQTGAFKVLELFEENIQKFREIFNGVASAIYDF